MYKKRSMTHLTEHPVSHTSKVTQKRKYKRTKTHKARENKELGDGLRSLQ